MRVAEIAALLRELSPQVLAVLVRRHGHFSDVEDALQDALVAASTQWPVDGVPANPAGWLRTVATRRYTDAVRSDIARRRREESAAADAGGLPWAMHAFVPPPDEIVHPESDDTLALYFMCCHPSLSRASAAALTLRALGGLTTQEIAQAFLVPSATMGQRISRAKQTIRAAGAEFAMPADVSRASALPTVLDVLYLLFSEGYAASGGDALLRVDLSHEAIRLTRQLHALLPTHGEVLGLLALMLLTDARREARVDACGALVTLDAQDRTRWNGAMIREGVELVERAFTLGPPGPFALQAAIASLHDEATSTDTTDWPQILALYDVLAAVAPSPMVSLNRAIAVAMVRGPVDGLSLVDELMASGVLEGHHRVASVRAHLLELSGDTVRAAAEFARAAGLAANVAERHYLLTQVERLRGSR